MGPTPQGRVYSYVGPAEIPAYGGEPQGFSVRSAEELADALDRLGSPEGCTLTFVVDAGGILLVADRHSEHVNCAGGQPVLSAGELTVARTSGGVEVTDLTNQSTGYCPEPDSWVALERAIPDGVTRPDYWTMEFTFRRCPKCEAINIVKEGFFFCGVYDSVLAKHPSRGHSVLKTVGTRRGPGLGRTA